MLVRRVVDHQVDHDAQSTLAASLGELHKISQCAEARIYPVVIGNIVAVISAWGRLKGHQPQGRNTDALQVIEAAHESLKIANSVAIGVQVGGDRKAVNDGVLVPKIVDHGESLPNSFR